MQFVRFCARSHSKIFWQIRLKNLSFSYGRTIKDMYDNFQWVNWKKGFDISQGTYYENTPSPHQTSYIFFSCTLHSPLPTSEFISLTPFTPKCVNIQKFNSSNPLSMEFVRILTCSFKSAMYFFFRSAASRSLLFSWLFTSSIFPRMSSFSSNNVLCCSALRWRFSFTYENVQNVSYFDF